MTSSALASTTPFPLQSGGVAVVLHKGNAHILHSGAPPRAVGISSVLRFHFFPGKSRILAMKAGKVVVFLVLDICTISCSKLDVRFTEKGGVQVPDMVLCTCKNDQEVMDTLYRGVCGGLSVCVCVYMCLLSMEAIVDVVCLVGNLLPPPPHAQ